MQTAHSEEFRMPRTKKDIGLAIIGCGRIGSLRARLAKMHPAVGFIALMDRDAAAAEKLAKDIGADFWCTDRHEAMSHPEVNAIIVATSEHEHTHPVVDALERQVPVLVRRSGVS